MDYSKEIISRLERVEAAGERPTRIFEDFLDITEATLKMMPMHARAAAQTGRPAEDTPEVKELWARMRSKYNPEARVTHKSKSRGYFDLFAECFGMLTLAVDTPIQLWTGDQSPDILGDVYMLYCTPSHWHGQFFTPWPVAKLMAQMTIESGENDYPIVINDPCCGSGVMLLAAASQFTQWQIQSGLVQFSGQDIDSTCVKMCKINLHMYGLTPLWQDCALELSRANQITTLPINGRGKAEELARAIESGEEIKQLQLEDFQ